MIALWLIKVNNKWPAIILAVSRMVSVMGRIKLLIFSINTIKGIRIYGVPWGIWWQNIVSLFLNHLKIINLNHIGKEILKEKIKWLDLVKIYGNNPIMLFIKIINISEIKKILLIILNLLNKINLNSLNNFLII